MNDFFYNISFFKEDDLLQLNIDLTYDDYLVPVFNRAFYNNKREIKQIHDQIFEYFNHTNLKMTKNDVDLFYNAFKDFDIKLPNPFAITILDIDFHSTSGLSPKEMLFLMYIDHKGIDAKKAKYWVNEYHLDINYTIDKLIQLDYITTDDYLFNLSKATKKELCAPLDQNNISYGGNKPDILKIVKNSFTKAELKNYFTGLYYKQTIKGEEISISNQYLNDFHKSYYRYANQLKIEEFYILNKRFKDLDAKDVCKMMVEKKKDKTPTDFDWDKFFEDEVKNEDEIKDFAEVVKKYTINKKDESQEVTEKDFFDVVFKGKSEEDNVIKQEEKNADVVQMIKKDLSEAEEEFFKVVYKERKVLPKTDKIEQKINSDEEAFLNVVNKERKVLPKKDKIEQKINSDEVDDAFFKVINKNRKEKSKKEKHKVESHSNLSEAFFRVQNQDNNSEEKGKIVEQEKHKYGKKNNLNTVKSSLFMRLFVYSSVISLVIIYTLYQFVFK